MGGDHPKSAAVAVAAFDNPNDTHWPRTSAQGTSLPVA